ncbi:MAG: cytochrome c [Bacteroidota bacterium]
MKTKTIVFSFVVLMGSLMMLSMTSTPQAKGKPWTIPANFVSKKNPVKSDAASIDAATVIWNKNCKSCHGVKGLGDGTKAGGLKTAVPSFATKEFQSQKDGAIFFQVTSGRDEMPAFEKKITSEDERWMLVNLMRTFGK